MSAFIGPALAQLPTTAVLLVVGDNSHIAARRLRTLPPLRRAKLFCSRWDVSAHLLCDLMTAARSAAKRLNRPLIVALEGQPDSAQMAEALCLADFTVFAAGPEVMIVPRPGGATFMQWTIRKPEVAA